MDQARVPLCPNGHRLHTKVASGGLLGLRVLKCCARCGKGLRAGETRLSCKPCKFHLCKSCWDGVRHQAPHRRAATAPQFAPPARPLSAVHFAHPPARHESGSDLKRTQLKVCDSFHAGKEASQPSRPSTYKSKSWESTDDKGLGVPAAAQQQQRYACRYGAKCYQRNAAHLENFVHPGDRHYRRGLVSFEDGQQPEFESLWELFQFHDREETGHLSLEEFSAAFATCAALCPALLDNGATADQGWFDAGGHVNGYVNFREFASWTQSRGVELPIGLESPGQGGASRPCRFRSEATGSRCNCRCFEPQAGQDSVCSCCGHKSSMHRSDLAQRTVAQFVEDSSHPHWQQGKEGLVQVHDPVLLSRLQDLLGAAHKRTDNWTRDRGCKLHGVNGCAAACASKNRRQVPRGYFLVSAYRNQNPELWQKYALLKAAVSEDCSRAGGPQHQAKQVATSSMALESLDAKLNEWYLFHGTSASRARSICKTNFRLGLAGSGATWKEPGHRRGTPLYGFGIYFAEHLTKADEYSASVDGVQGLPAGCHVVLLCRVLGGRTNVVTSNEIEVGKLRADVFEGPYHSVLGDRVASLGKPFREVVVYDQDHCYPEFLLVYRRMYE